MRITSTSLIKKLLVLFLVFAGLYVAEDFLVPFVIAGVLATLLLPFNKALERRGVPKVVAILVSLLLILAVVAGISFLLVWQISDLTSDLSLLKQKAGQALVRLSEKIAAFTGISIEHQSQLLLRNESSVTSIVQLAAGSLIGFFSGFTFVMAYIGFLLYYRDHLKAFLLKLMPATQRSEMEQVIYKAAGVSQQYLLGLSKMIVLLWIMYGIGFSLLGLRNALFFAFLCGLLEIVPYIGNITGTTLTVLVAAIHGESLPVLGAIVCVYGGIQFIQGWLLEPLILGPQVRINSLFTIIALVIGGMVWGVAGIFLAIPMMAISKIVLDHIEPLKPYGFLIGEREKRRKS